MQGKNDTPGSLYNEKEYAVNPTTYPPSGIDAVAGYLQEKFALEGLPPIGLVRHVIAHPEGGLERIIKERSADTPDSKLKRRVERHAGEIRQLLAAATAPRAPEPVKREPYLIAQPIRTIEFSETGNPDFAQWLQEKLTSIRTEALRDPPSFDALDDVIAHFAEATSETAENVKALLETLRTHFESSEKKAKDVMMLFGNIYGVFNSALLLGQGKMLTCNDAIEEDIVVSKVHEMHVYDSPKGEIGVAYVSPFLGRSDCPSPCYDSSTDVVRLDTEFMACEVHQAATHGMNSNHARAISDAVGDYRYGRLERDFYRNLWNRYGNKDLLMRLAQDFLSEDQRDGYTMMKKVRNTEIFRAHLSGILAEELRHAIDVRHMRDAHRHYHGPEAERPLRTATLFGSNSQIKDGFLGITLPDDEKEVDMLMMAIDELVGKMTATAVSLDPQLMIAHFRYIIEQSRIASKNRVQTFRDDLAVVHANAPAKEDDSGKKHEKQEPSASWPHALGAKMSATMFGRHLGILQRDFHLDAPYDHIELLNALDKVGKLPPEKVRLAVRNMMNPQLVIPVDCKPFRKIDDEGFMAPLPAGQESDDVQLALQSTILRL